MTKDGLIFYACILSKGISCGLLIYLVKLIFYTYVLSIIVYWKSEGNSWGLLIYLVKLIFYTNVFSTINGLLFYIDLFMF